MLGVPLLGAAGLAIDVSRMMSAKAELQSALDAAVLAGAPAIGAEAATAQKIFDANLTPEFVGSPANFIPQADGVLSGFANAAVPTTISAIFGVSTFQVSVTASAQVLDDAPPNRACILLLDRTNAGQGYLGNSGARIVAPTCEMHVRTTRNPATIMNNGPSLDLARICVAGGQMIINGPEPANLERNCAAATDPFAGALPAPPSTSCTQNARDYNGGTVNLSPGVYCGNFNFNSAPRVNFAPGVYVIRNGNWNVNGGVWQGAGVTFYYEDSSFIQFNSGMDMTLSAPTSGTYQGILWYERPGLPIRDIAINSTIRNQLSGLMYLPSRNVTYNADSNTQARQLTLVFNRLIHNNATLSLEPAPFHLINAGASADAREAGAARVRLIN